MSKQRLDKIIFATGNNNKLREVRKILRELSIEIDGLNSYPNIAAIKETGNTFEENALIKANTLYHHTGLWTIADDSGLEVDALDGAPGVFSARFAGKGHDYDANNQKLLAMMKDVQEDKRTGRFRCVAAIVGPGFQITVDGTVRGMIIRQLRGDNGFGYDPLFVPEGYDITYAEMDEELKNKISHRAAAFNKVKEKLKEILMRSAR